jgi:MFS family permease
VNPKNKECIPSPGQKNPGLFVLMMNRIIPQGLAAIIAIISLAVMAMSVLQPVLPLYLTSIGINPTILGLMFSVAMIGMVFGESSGGWLADKVGVRIPLSVGTFVCAPIVLCFVFTQNIPFIFVIFLSWGIVRAAIFGPGRGYIGATVPPSQKATFMAIYAAFMAVSRSLGTFLGGFIADARGYDWCFFTSVGIVLLGGILVIISLRKIPRVKPALPRPISPADSGTPTRAPYRSRPFLSQCAVGALCWTSIGVVGPFLPLLAVKVAGVAVTEVGILLTIGALVNASLLIPMGRLSDRKNKKILMIVGLLVTAAGLAGLALAKNFPSLVAAVVTQSVGGAVFSPAAVSLLSDTVPLNWQNTAMGIYGACEDIGVVAGSALGGLVWSALGPPSTFFLVGMIAAVLGAIVSFTLLRDKVIKKPPY